MAIVLETGPCTSMQSLIVDAAFTAAYSVNIAAFNLSPPCLPFNQSLHCVASHEYSASWWRRHRLAYEPPAHSRCPFRE